MRSIMARNNIEITSDVENVIHYFRRDISKDIYSASGAAIKRAKKTMHREASVILRQRYNLKDKQAKPLFNSFGKTNGSLDKHFFGVHVRSLAIPLASFLTPAKTASFVKSKRKLLKNKTIKILKSRTTKMGEMFVVKSKFKKLSNHPNQSGHWIAHRRGNQVKERFLQSPHIFYQKDINQSRLTGVGILMYQKRLRHEMKWRLGKKAATLSSGDKRLLKGIL